MRLFLVAFLFNIILTFGQDPYTVNYGLDEGLPTSNIYCVFEDDDGYIWFGTDVGVLRYDGYSFEHLSTDDGLGDNEVFQMYKDRLGRIWFLTLNGQLSYYYQGIFTNTQNNELLKDASHPKVMIDAYELDNHIYFLYRDGFVSKVDLSANTYNKYKLNKAIFGHWKIDQDLFYLSLDAIFNESAQEHYSFQEYTNSAMYYRNLKYVDQNLFSINNAIFEFTQKGVTKLEEFHDEVIHMNELDGNLWLGTRSGLIIKEHDKNQRYFEKDVISYVLKDSQSNYWVTTLNNGIKFIPNFKVFKHAVADESVKITTIKKHEDHLFVGTEMGLYSLQYDPSFRSVASTKLSSDYIKKIRSYHGRAFAIGNTSVDIFDQERVIPYKFGANDFYYDGTHYFFSSSVVFKFFPNDIYRFPKLRRENDIKAEALKVNTLFRKRTNVILPYKDDALLFGTSTGLNIYRKNEISDINAVTEGLNTSILNLYHDDQTDFLYVVTNSLGVIVLKNNKVLHQINKKQGLSSNSCYDIHPYNEGFLVATNKGVDWIEIEENKLNVVNVNAQFLLKSEKVNAIEVIDSVVLFGTDKGLLSFNYQTSLPESSKPKLVLETLLINDQKVENLSALKSDQNNLRLSFTGISFKDYGDLSYQYKDNDGSWTDLDNRNLEIQNLASGTHKIQVRAKGKNDIWSEIEKIELNIKAPFWRTIPFLFLASLLIAIGVYFIVGSRIKSMKHAFNKERKLLNDKQEKIALEKQMVDLEQKALRMQMNPHFVFNALNTIKGYYTSGEIKEANKYISQFSKLLRMILESDQRLISLEREIKIISLYLELITLRYDNVFKSEIIVDPELNIKDTGIPTLLLQPLVENAIIHGLAPKNEKGKLLISFEKKDNSLICKVVDNGIGISKSKASKLNGKHRSKALQITRERIEMENELKSSDNFIIQDREDAEGTEAIIRLPIINYW